MKIELGAYPAKGRNQSLRRSQRASAGCGWCPPALAFPFCAGAIPQRALGLDYRIGARSALEGRCAGLARRRMPQTPTRIRLDAALASLR